MESVLIMIAIAVGCAIGLPLVAGVIITLAMEREASGVSRRVSELMDEAIERGFAEYDGRTGEWRWKGE